MDVHCPTCTKFLFEMDAESDLPQFRHPCQHCRVNLIISRQRTQLIIVTVARQVRLADMPRRVHSA